MNGSYWPADEFYVAKLLAVKRTVVTVSKWPLPVIRQFQKATLNTGHSNL
jgi:hypothetical protein